MSSIKSKIATAFAHLCCLCPINKKKVVFTSYNGKYYNDAPKVISEALDAKDVEKVWIINDQVELPPDVRRVKPASLAAIYELETAKIWVDNCRKYEWAKKREHQFYIQTWHGGVALKKVEADTIAYLSDYYIRRAKIDSQNIDLFVSESEWRTNNILSAFWYNGEIMKCTVTRGNIYSSAECARKVRNYYHLDQNVKIALYAPTFRKSKRIEECYDVDYQGLLSALKGRFGGEWVALVRLHPNISNLSDQLSYDANILNATQYPQMGELIAACDVLLTDYSGCMFDGFRQRKPVFLFATDYEEYVKDRGIYFDLLDFPAPLARSNEELCKVIGSFDEKIYREKADELVDKLGFYQTEGAGLLAERIMQEMKR